MAEKTREERLKVFTEFFPVAAKYYFRHAGDDMEKDFVIRALEDSLRNFTSDCKKNVRSSCPKGWTECWDGSCAPPGALCTHEHE